MWHAITDVPDILVGQVSDFEALTGCTVLVFPEGAVGGVDLRGSATGTREIDTLSALHITPRIHAIPTGGSAYGLEAAGGVVQALEEQGIGFGAPPAHPDAKAICSIWASARQRRRPDAAMGYTACRAAMAMAMARQHRRRHWRHVREALWYDARHERRRRHPQPMPRWHRVDWRSGRL